MDLIEGAYVGVGLASDVELFEQFPYDYTSYSKRQHRWIRGDWQIASWILQTVPNRIGHQRAPNPLTAINRWKILDNLRRSLVPPAVLLLLICSWSLHPQPIAASALVGFVLLVPLFIQLLRRLVNRLRGDVRALAEASSDLNRAIVMAAFLPHQAYLALDAIGRACYRVWVSRRNLLEWQTAEMSHLAARAHLDAFRAQFLLISVLAAAFFLLLDVRGRFWEPAWAPFLLLWVGAPAIQHWIGWQRRSVRKLDEIDAADETYLRRMARETWRYFDDLIGAEHNWLPPDNFQEALRVETAARTSPTNVGMWLMSAVSAADFGFLTPDQLIDRCSATMDTLQKLERYDGHILNWYDTRTLAALEPRYVSTVDNGNLVASLWVLSQTCQELEKHRQLESQALRGLADTLNVVTNRFPPDHTSAIPLETLRALFQLKSSGIEVTERIRLAVEPARKLMESLRWSTLQTDERTYWFTQLEEHVQQWVAYFDHHLRWADVLAAPPDEFIRPLGEKFIAARRQLLRELPSWGELSKGTTARFLEINLDIERNEAWPAQLDRWLAELRSELDKAAAAAQSFLARARDLAQMSENLAGSMNMRLLYDPDRRLFGIGYQAGAPRAFSSHYDLLASESRLTSLIAIARNEVPVEHWLALGRPYTTGDGQVLLSWSGTMFEYLMPLLFTRSFRNSLLENACAIAVKRQIEYGRERGVPWGISESASSRVDIHKIYQYQAFGVPSLGLKRGLEEDLVVAPYATALALVITPSEAVGNLKRLEEAGLLTFVPVHTGREDPIRIQRLQIRNRSSRWRHLSVTTYAELVLGTDREVTQMYVTCWWDESAKALFARNAYHRDYGRRLTFAAIAPDAVSYTSDRTEFLGRHGSADAPAALGRVSLSNRAGAGVDPCAALQTKFEIGPGQETTVILLFGEADDVDQARGLITRYRDPRVVERGFSDTRQWWDRLLSTIQVETPILSVNLMLNRWLLYQSLSCRIWGRSALYQSSGAFGFRDQLQDALAFVYSAPDITREMILRAASRQFIEGDVQHWWHLPCGEGIRTRCSDDLLWLPYACCHYVETTGDAAVLDVAIGFLEGPELKDDELEAFFQPSTSSERASLFEHCRRAIARGTTEGVNGLPLIGSGDWNDGMNRVGTKGKGESVWLGWFLVDILNRFARLCVGRGEDGLAHGYRDRATSLSATIERTSWDGAWYRRAYFDDGTPLGSKQNDEAQIDSLPQSWSVISDAADPDRAARAMHSVEEYLVRRKEKLVLLFTPPFDRSEPHPGYIMAYPPGVRENGAQYTHAALWVAMAFARMGQGARAVEILQMLNPIEHARNPEEYATYQVEPYAAAADVYSLETRVGRGGWTWYTGSAGWMYRVWLEEVLGFKLRGARLSIDPAIPQDWPGYVIKFRYGSSEYRIEVEDGTATSQKDVLLKDDGKAHTLRFSAGRRDLPTVPSISDDISPELRTKRT